MKIALNAKTTIIIIFLLLVAGLIVLAVTFFPSEKENGIARNLSCVSSTEERTVRGNSLTGLIEPGQTVKILFGYYDCNEVKREDVIVYSYAGNEVPIIKIAKGISGDKFQLKKSEAGCWNILINGKIIKNSQNLAYCISDQGYRMLSLYERDYNGVIPLDAYLILGNLTGGAIDSTRFGLVSRQDLLGKVEVDPVRSLNQKNFREIFLSRVV